MAVTSAADAITKKLAIQRSVCFAPETRDIENVTKKGKQKLTFIPRTRLTMPYIYLELPSCMYVLTFLSELYG